MQPLKQYFKQSSSERHKAKASERLSYFVIFMSDLVSIITPTYNCGHFVEETIRSVIAQTYGSWEMIIVDDCSTDQTRDIIEKWVKQDSRIRYYRNEENLGPALTRNKALREARGRWIAFLDSDDLWKPEKLERQIDFMSKNNYAFTYHLYDEIDEQSKPTGTKVSGPNHITLWGMYAYCWPGCLTVMYDRNVIGEMQMDNIRICEDYALWLKITRKADCHLYPALMAHYRRRHGSISSLSLFKLIKCHYRMFSYADQRNPLMSFFLTILNIAFGSAKKVFYVKRRSCWTKIFVRNIAPDTVPVAEQR